MTSLFRGSGALNQKYLDPSRNIVLAPAAGGAAPELFEHTADEGFWAVLAEIGGSVAITREYEHLFFTLAWEGEPWQSHLELPHPSGVAWDASRRRLYVSSTRWPNQIFELLAIDAGAPTSLVVGAEAPRLGDRTLLAPIRSWYLPGSLDIHEVGLHQGAVVFTATGHNFLAALDESGGWRRLWWPRVLDELAAGPDARAFNQKYFQLNGMALGSTLDDFLFTGFSDETSGPKPWKAGYGPRGKGVVFSGRTRDVVARGLTCPHSVRWYRDTAWLCDSGFGTVGFLQDGSYVPMLRVPGFTRGLAFHGRYGFVGLSRVIPKYESYAPGITPDESRCGVVAFDTHTGAEVGRLVWPHGYQVFDVQLLPGVRRPFLPPVSEQDDESKAYLLHYGYDRDAGAGSAGSAA